MKTIKLLLLVIVLFLSGCVRDSINEDIDAKNGKGNGFSNPFYTAKGEDMLLTSPGKYADIFIPTDYYVGISSLRDNVLYEREYGYYNGINQDAALPNTRASLPKIPYNITINGINVFLVDKDNNILLVGNPLYDHNLKKQYIDLIMKHAAL